jgi:hypothetical protein
VPVSLLAPVVRVSDGSTLAWENQDMSVGWQTRTGARVVGRSTPAGLTGVRMRLLTRVDLPAPVEPPTTTSSGASSRSSLGSR